MPHHDQARPHGATVIGILIAFAGLLGLAGSALGAPLLGGAPVPRSLAVAEAPGGALAIDVTVREPGLAPLASGRVDTTRAEHRGLVRLRVIAPSGRVLASAGAREPLLLAAPSLHRYRVVLRSPAARRVRAAAAAGAVRVAVVAQSRLLVEGRRRPREITARRRVIPLPAAGAWAAAPAARPLPRCETAGSRATAARTTRMVVRCSGDAPRIELAGGPRRGSVRLLHGGGGRAVLAYRAPAATGLDVVRLRATNASGSVLLSRTITVRPFTMRALGDSVTAGFGFLPDGTPMGITQLPFCVPPDQLNDRCSSNSDNGPGSGGAAAWSPDFGLSDDIAWPAQFANDSGIAPSAFENRAVSGSTPSDWLGGGQLNDTLAGIIADDPDLTVLTLGANPLLDTFLAGSGIGCAITLSDPAFRACVQGYLTRLQVTPRVGQVVAQLMLAPENRVVVSQYHLAIPSATIFSVSSLRIMSEELNAAVAAGVRSAPQFGTRVFLMTPPLFPAGLGPGDAICPNGGLSSPVDGESRQSDPTQDELAVLDPFSFCGSDEFWIISGDTGIHPSAAGHSQFAAALGQVVQANHLMP